MDNRLWIDRKVILLLGFALLLSGGWVALLAPTAFAAGGTIRGTVTAETGTPLSSIAVTAYRLYTDTHGTVGWDLFYSATTGANGTYQLTNLPAGGYRLGFGD